MKRGHSIEPCPNARQALASWARAHESPNMAAPDIDGPSLDLIQNPATSLGEYLEAATKVGDPIAALLCEQLTEQCPRRLADPAIPTLLELARDLEAGESTAQELADRCWLRQRLRGYDA